MRTLVTARGWAPDKSYTLIVGLISFHAYLTRCIRMFDGEVVSHIGWMSRTTIYGYDV
jgi:hypothetical protein